MKFIILLQIPFLGLGEWLKPGKYKALSSNLRSPKHTKNYLPLSLLYIEVGALLSIIVQ
jgi:hypothetical protein